MFSTKLATLFAALAVAASAVSAAPATFSGGKVDIVFRPEVTAPTEGAVWPAGSTQTITWDTSAIPAEARNQTGLILLGYLVDGDATGNEHLDTANALASGFPITAGTIDVVIPEVDPRNDYVVVLFGDSGNTSPKFTITNTTASASSSALPTVPTGIADVLIPGHNL
ncbi:hypothetical protein TRAPUB_13646 [Trametes pubescens]|uniref:Uncharacterized protein n=1 Tax=Trametes pubescens TaxID=154538 RepID=A0A1M2VQN4_TRAPU|nr:hypothetical protein TRAPUB_13646 [Trametes pubescens]